MKKIREFNFWEKMKKRESKFLVKLKNRLKEFFWLLHHPRMIFSKIIYWFYKGKINKVPYPLLPSFINCHGCWAGVSLYMEAREYQYNLNVTKAKKLITNFITPILILVALVFAGSRANENFFFGFAQNLLADIVLLILIIYILPKLLNPPNKHNISLEQRSSIDQKYDDESEIIFFINNNGEEIYNKEEIHWEIFIDKGIIKKEDVIKVEGDMEEYEELPRSMWRFFGINKSPIFIDEQQDILKVKFKFEVLRGAKNDPFTVYYRFRTTYGNIPTFENSTQTFMGSGISFEKYPKIGELNFTSWNWSEDDPTE